MPNLHQGNVFSFSEARETMNVAMNGQEYASGMWDGWCRGEQHTEAWSHAGHSLVTRATSKRAYNLFCWKNQELMLHTNATCR